MSCFGVGLGPVFKQISPFLLLPLPGANPLTAARDSGERVSYSSDKMMDNITFLWLLLFQCVRHCKSRLTCIHTVSQKTCQLWNGIAQNYKDRFWWNLEEIFKIQKTQCKLHTTVGTRTSLTLGVTQLASTEISWHEMSWLVKRDVVVWWGEFMRQWCPLWVERIVQWVVEKVDKRWRVYVGKPVETTSEIRRIVIWSEQTAKPNVKQFLHQLSVYTHIG